MSKGVTMTIISVTPTILQEITQSFTREAKLNFDRINSGEFDNKTTIAVRFGEFCFNWNPEVDDQGQVTNF